MNSFETAIALRAGEEVARRLLESETTAAVLAIPSPNDLLPIPRIEGPIRLAPSSIDYLLRCDTCLVRSLAYGLRAPGSGFPLIFNRIDGLQSDTFVGSRLEHVNPDIPPGIVETTQLTLKSSPIEVDGHAFVLNGRADFVCRLDNGNMLIIDNKTADPGNWPPEKYSTQASAYCLVAQQMGETVDSWGILYFQPDSYSVCNTPTPRHALFGKSELHLRSYHTEEILGPLGRIAGVLNRGAVPYYSEDCRTCTFIQQASLLV